MKLLLLILLCSFGAQAVTQKPVSHDTGGVKTDDRNFKEIFESNLKQSQLDLFSQRPKYSMEFSFSNSNPIGSKFANDYYEIAYSDQVKSLSTLSLYAEHLIEISEGYFLKPIVGLSYTFEESILFASAKNGGRYKDVVRFQSIPIFLGSKLGYKLSFMKISTLFTRIGLNYEWVSIAGSLDGINQSYWNPGYSASLGATMFEPESLDMNSWFGGVSVSAGLLRPFSENSKGSKINRVEVGLNFLL